MRGAQRSGTALLQNAPRVGAWALTAACQGGPLTVDNLQATVSEDVVTVVTLTYTTKRKETTQVEFGANGAYTLATPEETEATTEHTAFLVGMPADTEVSYRVVGTDGEAGASGTVTTGTLPAGVPVPSIEGSSHGEFLLTSRNGPTNWIVMLDPDGNVVWYYDDHRGLSLFRARVARDQQGVLFTSAIRGGGPADDSSLVRVSWVGGAETEHTIPALAHDFVELADGTVVSLAYYEQDEIEGNSLLAIDGDGGTTELWNSWDCYDPEEDLGDDPTQGWTHANALDVLEDGTYLVSLRNFGTITRVDPANRACTWGFGGPNGTITLDGGRFIHQHQFEWTGQEMVVFDNDGPSDGSRIAEYTFDGTGTSAPLVREIFADPVEYSSIMGDVHRFDDGTTLVSWALPRKIDLIDGSDTRLWRVELDGNGPLGFAQILTDPYREAP